MATKPETTTDRAPSFRGITVRLPLKPGQRRAALAAHKTKKGIEKHAAELLDEHLIKPLDEAVEKAEAAEAERKKKAAEDRAAKVEANRLKREREAHEKKVDRLATEDPDLLREALEKLEGQKDGLGGGVLGGVTAGREADAADGEGS